MKRSVKKFTVKLRGKGNPDFRQYGDVALPEDVQVGTLEEASTVCRKYIEENELGIGNWVGDAGIVLEGRKQVARIGWSGKVFKPDYPKI